MAAPTSGPFLVRQPGNLTNAAFNDYGQNAGEFLRTQRIYRQAKPVDRPLPYDSTNFLCQEAGAVATTAGTSIGNWYSVVKPMTGSGTDNSIFNPNGQIFPCPERDRALNKARERFFEKANERVDLAVAFLQRREAASMIANRGMQLLKLARAIRKGDVHTAAAEIGLSRPPRGHKWRQQSKDVGGLWLEYSYGWKPLVSDLYKATDVLASPYDPIYIRTSASEAVTRFFQSQRGNTLCRHAYQGRASAQVGATVAVTPHGVQIQSLKNAGVTNPLTWAWEVIPFSFVVDWFVNVGDVLQSIDDTVGLTITSGYYTTCVKGSSSLTAVNTYTVGAKPYPAGNRGGDFGAKVYSTAFTRRTLGLPAVKLVRQKSVITGLSRAANAISLLTQFLGKK